jgi:subtilisin family serine protease
VFLVQGRAGDRGKNLNQEKNLNRIMKLPSCIDAVAVAVVALAAISTCTKATSIRNKLVTNINETEQTLIDFVADVSVPIVSTSRRVWITYERGKQVSVLSSMEFNRKVSTNMMPIYDFPAMSSIVTMATDEEIAALMANTTIGSINVTDDPIRYPMVHSTRNVHQGYRNLQSGQTTPYGIGLTQVDQLWRTTRLTGEGITVCVIDSGVETSHMDLNASAFTGDSLVSGSSQWYTDSSGHGTHVSGIVAALNNGIGVVGAAPGVKVHMIDVFGDDGFAYASALVDAAYKCRDAGAKIISMSLGGPEFSDQENRLFTELYKVYGILSIASSGNDGLTGSVYSYPASYDNVLSVGAVSETKKVAYFSTYNDRVDLVAPGVDVYSTLPTGFCEIFHATGQFKYGYLDGTSMAAPYVAGIAALLWSYNISFKVDMIYNALLNSAEDLGVPGRDVYYGNGLVSALAAFNWLTSDNVPPNSAPFAPSPSFPTTRTTASPASAPITYPSAPTSSCVDANLVFKTGASPFETTFKLTDVSSGLTLWYDFGTEPYTEYNVPTVCLNPNGCYRFEAYDLFGEDGGGVAFELTYGNVLVASGTSVGSLVSVSYNLGGGCQI